jgi:hypothetical protein
VIGSVENKTWLKELEQEQLDVIMTTEPLDPNSHYQHLVARISSLVDQSKGEHIHVIYFGYIDKVE